MENKYILTCHRASCRSRLELRCGNAVDGTNRNPGTLIVEPKVFAHAGIPDILSVHLLLVPGAESLGLQKLMNIYMKTTTCGGIQGGRRNCGDFFFKRDASKGCDQYLLENWPHNKDMPSHFV